MNVPQPSQTLHTTKTAAAKPQQNTTLGSPKSKASPKRQSTPAPRSSLSPDSSPSPKASSENKSQPDVPSMSNVARSVSQQRNSSSLDIPGTPISQAHLNSTEVDKMATTEAAPAPLPLEATYISTPMPCSVASPEGPHHQQTASPAVAEPETTATADQSQARSYTELERSNKDLQLQVDLLKKEVANLENQLVVSCLETTAIQKVAELEALLTSAITECEERKREVDDLMQRLNCVTIERDVAQDKFDEGQEKLAACSAAMARFKDKHQQAIADLDSASEFLHQPAKRHNRALQILQKTEASAMELQYQVQAHFRELVETMQRQRHVLEDAAER
ncbi:kinesin family member 3A [Microdochium nivale]|nr:kinesin family member 3A [Microdochium nivale]